MKLDRRRMEQAVSQNIITPAQAEELWAFWQSQRHDTPHFTFIHVLYYLGGMIAIAAMTLFVTIGFMQFGSGFVAVVSAVYAALAVGLAEYFQKKGMPIPSGICATLAVALVPLFVFTVQDMMGYWPSGTLYRDYHTWIDWRWLTMESATLVAGAAMFKRYRYPFLLMPVAFTLWYMSMDCADWLFDWLTSGSEQNDWPTWSQRQTVKSWVSVAFGLLMLLPAFKIDFHRPKSERDYAFWLYLFGVLTFWGGLTSMDSDNELGKFIYFCINTAMVLAGSIIQRRVFTVFGALGMMFYLGHLAYSVFKDSILFPIALSLIGLAVVMLGVWWQKRVAEIRRKLLSLLPAKWAAALTEKY